MGIPISDLMKLPLFLKNIKLIAGHAGIDKTVQRVAVMEVADFALDNLDEVLILTTFSYMFENKDKLPDQFRLLVGKNIAGLVIKINRYITQIPQDIITIANECNIPVFFIENTTIRFRDVVFDIVTEINRWQYGIIKSINEQHEMLYKAILDGEKIDYFIHTFGRIFGVNCFCLLPDGKILAQFLTPSNATFHNDDQYFTHISDLYKNIKQKSHLFMTDNAVVFPCIVQNKIAGFFVIQKDSTLSEHEMMFARQTVSFLSIKLLEADLLRVKEYSMTTVIIDQILFREPDSEEMLKERLLLLGFVPKDDFCVIRIQEKELAQPQYLPIPSPNIINLSHLIKKKMAASLVHPISGGLIIIVPLAKGDHYQLIEKIQNKIESIIHCHEIGNQIYVGISLIHSNLKHIPKAYNESMRALHFAKYYPGEIKIHSYYDFPELRVADHLVNTDEHRFIIENILMPIRKYDEQYNSNLWLTLEKCIVNHSLDKAALDLHVHVSTLRYRLQKIHELIHINYFTETGKYYLKTAYALSLIESQNE